jgi:hypothetical protein
VAIRTLQFKKKFGTEFGCAEPLQFAHGTFTAQTMDNFASSFMPWRKERSLEISRTIVGVRVKTARDGTLAP